MIQKLKIIMSKSKESWKKLRDLLCMCVCTPTFRYEIKKYEQKQFFSEYLLEPPLYTL